MGQVRKCFIGAGCVAQAVWVWSLVVGLFGAAFCATPGLSQGSPPGDAGGMRRVVHYTDSIPRPGEGQYAWFNWYWKDGEEPELWLEIPKFNPGAFDCGQLERVTLVLEGGLFLQWWLANQVHATCCPSADWQGGIWFISSKPNNYYEDPPGIPHGYNRPEVVGVPDDYRDWEMVPNQWDLGRWAEPQFDPDDLPDEPNWPPDFAGDDLCDDADDNYGYYGRYKGPFTNTPLIVILDDPEELAPWEYDPDSDSPNDIRIGVEARGAYGVGGCPNIFLLAFSMGRYSIRVTYEYVANEPPYCTPQPHTVCEGSTGEEPENTINLLMEVADDDGCIDCGTFVLPPDLKTEKGGDLIWVPCSGLGNQDPLDDECTTCLECNVIYIPPPGLCDDWDSFEFTVLDDCGAEVGCGVSIFVAAVNEPPVAEADQACTCEGTVVDIAVCLNDHDPDDDGGDCAACPLKPCQGLSADDIVITSGPSCGMGASATPLPGGVIRFDPGAFCLGCEGICTFSYKIRDHCSGSEPCQEALWSNEATVSVRVSSINEPPEPIDGPPLPRVCGGEWSDPVDLTEYVRDPDDADGCGAGLNWDSVVFHPSCGEEWNHIGGPLWRFKPPLDYCGPCTPSFTIFDEGCPSDPCRPAACPPDPLWVTCDNLEGCVDGPNHPPVAVDDCATVCEDSAGIIIDVCENDYDPDQGMIDDCQVCGCSLDCLLTEIQIVAHDPFGLYPPIPNGDGTVILEPMLDFCGSTWFTYTLRDSCPDEYSCGAEISSNVATVYVTVCPTNDAPIAKDDEAQTQIDTPVCIDVLANDSDPDEENGCGCPLDPESLEITWWDEDCSSGPPIVEYCVGTGEIGILFTPAPGYEGECCFGYRVRDYCGDMPPCGNCPSADCPVPDDCPSVNCPLVEEWAEAEVCVTIGACPPPCREPASLLIYPEFNNLAGVVSILSVTNTNRFEAIDVKFEYVDELTCSAFDRRELLTENDTFTLITNVHNPQQERGYVYVYAECVDGDEAVVFNHLIGNLMIVDGLEGLAFSVNPFCHLGIGVPGMLSNCGLPLTDLDGDGIRDLDGIEYDPVADQILIPRFLGQTPEWQSEMILIGLSGGSKFTTTVDFTIYNDNEEEFSSEYTFYCWTRVPLLDISHVFSKSFLVGGTNDDPLEILGMATEEAGWIRIDGSHANSSTTTIVDPAVYAVILESVSQNRYVADLPFESWCQDNGKLLPTSLDGEH